MERQKHKAGGSGRAEVSLRLADASLAASGSPRQTATTTSPTSPLSPRVPTSPSSPKSPGNKSLASPPSPPRSPQSPTSPSSAASSPTKTSKQTATTSHLVRSNSSAGATVKRNRSLRESIIARSRSLYGSNKSPVSPSRAAHGSTPSISQPVLVSGPAMYSEDGDIATAVARPPVPPRASAERILQPGTFISAGEARGLGVRPPLGPPSASSSHPSSSLYDVPSADASQTSFNSSTTRLPLANVPPMDGVWLDDDSDVSDDGATTSPVPTAPGSARRKSKTKTHRRGTSSGMSFASLRSLGSASRRSQTSPGERQGKTSSFMGRLRGNSSPAPPPPGFITKEMISGPSNFVHAGHMDASQLGGRPRPTLNTDLGPDGRPNSRPSHQHHQYSYSHSHIPPKSPQRGTGHFQSASTASATTAAATANDYKWRHDSNGSTFSTSASSASNVYSLPSTVSSEQGSPVVPPRSPQRRGHLPAQLLEDVLPAKGVAKQPSAESFASAWAAGRADDSGAPHGTLQQPWMPVDIPPSPTTVSSTSTGSTMRPVDRKASVLLPSPLFAGNNTDRDANTAVLQPALAHSQSYQRLLGTLGPRVSGTPQAPRLVPRAVAEESVLPPEYAHGRAPEWI